MPLADAELGRLIADFDGLRRGRSALRGRNVELTTRAIVLDANVLIRAVLGAKVSARIADHAARVNLLALEAVFKSRSGVCRPS